MGKIRDLIIKYFGKSSTLKDSEAKDNFRSELLDAVEGCIEKLKVEVTLEKPHLFQSNSTPNAMGGYSSVPFYCSLCYMGEMDIQDNKLKDGNYACHCSIWTNSCGGEWVGWFDKEKAKQLIKAFPCEENFRNQALTDAIANLRELFGEGKDG